MTPHNASTVPISIRLASAGDIPFIQTCTNEAYTPYIERMGRKPAPMLADFALHVTQQEVFVAESDCTSIGVLILVDRPTHLLLESVCVTLRFHSRGIGRQLISFAEQTAIERGYTRIELHTHQAMVENIAMYQHLGFTITNRRVVDDFERVYFRKNLVSV